MPRIVIDTDAATFRLEDAGGERALPLYSTEAFELVSSQWVTVGWNQKYTYTFSWLGRPIIQLPEDMVRIQEVICRVRPDVIVETGVAHGGSLIFYASLCTAMGHGRVVGIDVEIRPPNRPAIEAHRLSPLDHAGRGWLDGRVDRRARRDASSATRVGSRGARLRSQSRLTCARARGVPRARVAGLVHRRDRRDHG